MSMAREKIGNTTAYPSSQADDLSDIDSDTVASITMH
jgi:hypothetical protein